MVRDVIARDLRVLFVGINPGLYSEAVGHHFARPGNRFWKALRAAGIADLGPFEERRLLERGIGITNIVARASAAASELTAAELRAGARVLRRKVARWRPRVVAFLGIGAYRVAFEDPRAGLGAQREPLAGPRVWVLPNPSGLNASYQLPALARAFRAVWRDSARPGTGRRAGR